MWKKYAYAVAVLTFILSCGPKRPIIEVGCYTFSFKGQTYRLESVTPSYLEGYNILILKDGNQVLLKAIDKEQNGYLDKVEIGDISLEEADIIYREGIAEGERRGYIKKRTFAREYRTIIERDIYILSTYLLAVGEVYNRLSVVKRLGHQIEDKVLDLGADGKLDKVEKGIESLGYYQQFYKKVLNRGLMEGSVKKMDGMYIVVL